MYPVLFLMVSRATQCFVLVVVLVLPQCALFGYGYFLDKLISRKKIVRNVVFLGLYLGFLGWILIAPFRVDTPLLVDSEIPPKPKLIAHRGLRTKYPENTFESEFAAIMHPGVWAIETDITLSLDGVPFLLHDYYLHRTTDSRRIYPDRFDDYAASFTMNELEALDFGSWFGDEFAGIRVCSLARLLRELVLHPEKKIIFDIKGVPAMHPFAGKEKEMIFKDIADIGAESQIIVLNTSLTLKEKLQYKNNLIAVDAFHKSLPTKRSMRLRGANTINASWSVPFNFLKSMKRYHLNVYSIDEEFLFCEYWCLGVDSVTTNKIDKFHSLQTPLCVQRSVYFRILVASEIIFGVLLLLVTILLYLRRPRTKYIEIDSDSDTFISLS